MEILESEFLENKNIIFSYQMKYATIKFVNFFGSQNVEKNILIKISKKDR